MTQGPKGGVLHKRGDSGYEAARLNAVWNARKPDRFPDAILLARTDEDVVSGVQWARENGLKVSLRSGGHSFVGNGVRNGGLLIDLHQLEGDIEVNPDAATVTVRPATAGPAIDSALAPHGLFFPTGHAPTVGVGGFSLGGGYGWNSRTFGPACLSIKSIDAVLANGTFVHADDTNHPELLWAARGSGPGFFAAVTSFEMAVHPRHEEIRRTTHAYPIELRDEVLGWSYDLLPSLPSQVELSAKVGYTPAVGQPAVNVTATAFCTEASGLDLLAPLETAPFRERALRAQVNVPTSMTELYAAADSLTPPGFRWSLDGIWCEGDVAEILRKARPIFDGIPSDLCFVLWMLWGHYPERSDACWSTQATLYLSPNAGWSAAAADLQHELWAHQALADMGSISRGLQFSDNNLADRPDKGLSDENAARLEEIRTRYDPEHLFRTYMQTEESTTALGRSRIRKPDHG